jgi:hypothetical protein
LLTEEGRAYHGDMLREASRLIEAPHQEHLDAKRICAGRLARTEPAGSVPVSAIAGSLQSVSPRPELRRYLDVWTAWNHVRTLAPIASAILFTAALCLA